MELALTPVGNNAGLLAMPVLIGDDRVMLLIDTGAVLPTVSTAVADRINLHEDRPLLINDSRGVEAQAVLSQSVNVAPSILRFEPIKTPFVIFDKELAQLGINGMIPPQIFASQSCMEFSFHNETARFYESNCPTGQRVSDRHDLYTADLLDGKNRLVIDGKNPFGVEGKLIIDTGSEVSVFPRSITPNQEVGKDCAVVNSLSGAVCLSRLKSAKIEINGKTLTSSRALAVEGWSPSGELVGVIGVDVLTSATLQIFENQKSLTFSAEIE